MATAKTVPRLNTPAAAAVDNPASCTKKGTKLNPVALEAKVPKAVMVKSSQKARVLRASLAVQLNSGAIAGGRAPPTDAPACSGETPSGSKPMSSGLRLTNSMTGKIRARLSTPRYR